MKPRNILAITYWSFENALIQTYTLPYLLQIKEQLNETSKIYLFTLSATKLNSNETVKKQLEDLKTKNIHVLQFRYSKFGWLMLFKFIYILNYLIFFSLFKNINYIHAWCTPGGAIGYLVSILTHTPLVLDSFEPHAETMKESGVWGKNSLRFKLLFLMEKLQLKRAKEVICATEGMIGHSQELYQIKKANYFVKPACVDLNLFDPKKIKHELNLPLNPNHKVCVYAGKFGGIYLEQEVFDFFKTAYDHWHGNFTVILLTNHSDEEIETYCATVKLPVKVILKKFVKHNEVPGYLSLGHFGICPVKPLPSKRFCTPIKTGEYWAMGLPVVITANISTDSEIIEKNNIGYVLKSLDPTEYLNALNKMDELFLQKDLPLKIRKIAEQERNFSISRSIYHTIYA